MQFLSISLDNFSFRRLGGGADKVRVRVRVSYIMGDVHVAYRN